MSVSQPAGDIWPTARYRYDDIRSYFAYGNTPPEDFLQGCVGKVHPSILLLGCGDIRSCFYTLWKNFDFLISKVPKQFNGIDFLLNDWSSTVLARNVVFILMCLQLPESEGERKKWLSAMWAVWYCHELNLQHQKILDECLKLLLKYSESLDVWACSNNPLRNLVGFTSSNVLIEISLVWNMWLKMRGHFTVELMHSSRKEVLKINGVFDKVMKKVYQEE